MNQIKKFITWLSKAWPFIAIIFTATVHFNILKVCRTVDVDTINQYISSFTQIIGGLIILFNINSNLGLFKPTFRTKTHNMLKILILSSFLWKKVENKMPISL